ncbi:hypothetical protein pb186bvf_009056 [Paramecium bursaria]
MISFSLDIYIHREFEPERGVEIILNMIRHYYKTTI